MTQTLTIISGIIGVALVTALVAPGTRTAEIIRAIGGAFRNFLMAFREATR